MTKRAQKRLDAAIERLAGLFAYGELLASTDPAQLLQQAAAEIERLRTEWPWSLPEVGSAEQLEWMQDERHWTVNFGALWIGADWADEGADSIFAVHDIDFGAVQTLIARRNREDPPRRQPGEQDPGDVCARCGFPKWSDGECQGCDDPGSTCSGCDQQWCETCWDTSAHAEICHPATRGARAPDAEATP